MNIFGKSDAKLISEARVMIDALNRIGSASEDFPMGLGQTFINEFTTTRDNVVEYNAKIDKLNAELLSQTKQMDEELNKMKRLHSEAKERVKHDVPQEKWIEFGIEDKK